MRFGDIDEDLSGGMDNVEELHDGSAVVGDGDGSLIVVDELVHPSWTERGSNHIADRRDGIDVAQ